MSDRASTSRDETRFAAGAIALLLLRTSAHWPRFALGHGVWGAAALCSIIASLAAAPGMSGLLGGALAITMIAIAAKDARSFTIPDALVLVGLLLGVLNVSVTHEHQLAAGFAGAALRGSVLPLIFFSFRTLYRFVRGRQGIGLGDVKLVAVAGVWLNWMSISFAVDLAALAALAAVLVHAIRGQPVSGSSAIPFGLFFAPAIWLAWLLETISERLIG